MDRNDIFGRVLEERARYNEKPYQTLRRKGRRKEPESPQDTWRIPDEIFFQGPEAIKSYQSALENGSVNVYRASVKIIGQDRAGKTSLKRSLCGLPFIRNHESTVGVEVSSCSPTKSVLKSWQVTDNKGVIVEDDVASEIAKVYARQGDAETLEMEVVTDINSGASQSDKVASTKQKRQKLDRKDLLSNDRDEDLQYPRHERTKGQERKNRQIPKAVQKSLITFLRQKKIDKTIEDKEEIIIVWDFAGQQLYYASHPVFMSRRAVYILVYHLGKDLHAKAEPRVRQGTDEIILDNASNETNLDNLLSWLVSVHCLCQPTTNNLDQTEPKLHYARPPVIIVGTHKDELKGSDKERNDTVEVMERKIIDAIKKCAFRAHILNPYFAVDNSKSENDNGVQELHKKISEVLKEDPYYPQPVPVRWFHFEKALQTLVKEKEKCFVTEKELSKIAVNDCSVDHTEVETMLEFYHRLGIIIRYRDTVVLDVQWLIDVFKRLIIIKPHEDQWPIRAKFWTELEETGRLNNDLINDIFQELLKCDHVLSECDCQAKKDILHMMEHFGLIAKINISDDPKKVYYLVPSHLTSSPEEELEKCRPSPGEHCPLYIRFKDGYIPHGLYFQLVCRFCSIFASEEPQLFRNASIFVLDNHSETIVTLVCYKSTIKVLLHSQQSDPTDIDCKAVKVMQRIKKCLDSFKECPWYRGLTYEFCVQCPTCAKKSTSTTNSGQYFGDDVGLHPIKDGLVWCAAKRGKLKLQNIQCWCSCSTATSCFIKEAVAGPSSEGPALPLSKNSKRWLVVGITLMTILLPPLRDFTRKEISKHYVDLKKKKNIDSQSYEKHLEKDGTFELHYDSINDNEKAKPKDYDYDVKSEGDLAKLYLQPHMANFRVIDNSCDLSAVLGILSNASPFKTKMQDAVDKAKDAARKVKDAAKKVEIVAGRAKDVADKGADATKKARDAAKKVKDAAEKVKDATARAKDADEKAKDAADKGTDATKKAKDAAKKKVKDAAKKARDAAKEAKDAAKDAKDAAQKLQEVEHAAKKAKDPAKISQDAAKKAKDGAKKLEDEAKEMEDAAKMLQDAADGEEAEDAAEKLQDAAKEAEDAVEKLKDAGKEAEDAAQKLHDVAYVAVEGVRSVRNNWAHCNIEEWEDEHFQQCFQKMENLVKTLSLANYDKEECLKQLKEWKEKGVHRIGIPDDDLKKAVTQAQKEVQILREIPGEMIEKIITSLQDYEQMTFLQVEETVLTTCRTRRTTYITRGTTCRTGRTT